MRGVIPVTLLLVGRGEETRGGYLVGYILEPYREGSYYHRGGGMRRTASGRSSWG